MATSQEFPAGVRDAGEPTLIGSFSRQEETADELETHSRSRSNRATAATADQFRNTHSTRTKLPEPLWQAAVQVSDFSREVGCHQLVVCFGEGIVIQQACKMFKFPRAEE